MQHALKTGDSVIHVHLHGFGARPSSIDRRTYRELSGSLQVVAPQAAHGGLILGTRDAHCSLRLPAMTTLVAASVSVVGAPLQPWGRQREQ
jgi:hypothetical protein